MSWGIGIVWICESVFVFTLDQFNGGELDRSFLFHFLSFLCSFILISTIIPLCLTQPQRVKKPCLVNYLPFLALWSHSSFHRLFLHSQINALSLTFHVVRQLEPIINSTFSTKPIQRVMKPSLPGHTRILEALGLFFSCEHWILFTVSTILTGLRWSSFFSFFSLVYRYLRLLSVHVQANQPCVIHTVVTPSQPCLSLIHSLFNYFLFLINHTPPSTVDYPLVSLPCDHYTVSNMISVWFVFLTFIHCSIENLK